MLDDTCFFLLNIPTRFSDRKNRASSNFRPYPPGTGAMFSLHRQLANNPLIDCLSDSSPQSVGLPLYIFP